MLGWDDHAIMNTPLARLHLAIKGRGDFVSSILKAVFGKAEPDDTERALQTPANPEVAAAQVMAFFERRKQHDMRHRRKK